MTVVDAVSVMVAAVGTSVMVVTVLGGGPAE